MSLVCLREDRQTRDLSSLSHPLPHPHLVHTGQAWSMGGTEQESRPLQARKQRLPSERPCQHSDLGLPASGISRLIPGISMCSGIRTRWSFRRESGAHVAYDVAPPAGPGQHPVTTAFLLRQGSQSHAPYMGYIR